MDATRKNGFEATIEAAFSAQRPFYGLYRSWPAPLPTSRVGLKSHRECGLDIAHPKQQMKGICW